MVIDVEAKEYTLAEAEALLNHLYRYYDYQPRRVGETGEMVTRLQEQGFAGFTKVLELILNSDELTERVRKEFNELWGKHLKREATEAERSRWENRFRHGRARAREQFEQGATSSKELHKEALQLIDHYYPMAQALLETAIAAGIPDWDVYHGLGLALMRQKEYSEAIPWYQEAIWSNPNDDFVWSCSELAQCYKALDAFQSGFEFYYSVCQDQRYTERWPAWHHCGWTRMQLGSLQGAKDHYMRALELCRDPSWGWTANDLRHVYERQGKLDEALPFFLDLTAREPYSDDWGVWYARAYVEWKTGNAQGAVGCFERSIELHRQYWKVDGQYWTLIDYGWCLRDLERYDEALDRFERAKALDPRQWDGWHGVGWVLKKRQDFAGAKAHFEEALQLNSQSAWSWVELGYVYQYQTMASNPLYPIYAWEAYETALVVGASNESACAAAREAQALLNDKIGVPLQGFIESAYSLKDLEDLCFNLSIDFDNLSGDTKSSKIRHLILYCQRRGETLALIKQLHDRRAKLFPPLVTAPESRR